MRSIAVKGGIGDFLQCLPFMLEHPEHKYLVVSHHDCVAEFFAAFDIKVEEVSLGRLDGAELCPRRLFSDPWRRRPRATTSPTIGVHLGGSRYSLDVETRFGFPSKSLPLTVFNALCAAAPQYKFLLFGSPVELAAFGLPPRVEVAGNNLIASLARVSDCSAFIGSDSAFKTMSAMLQIPTVVWIGNYKDNFRDANFIDPYVEVGVMSVFRYKKLDAGELERGVQFSLKEVKHALAARCDAV